jgi:hypothetical protein
MNVIQNSTWPIVGLKEEIDKLEGCYQVEIDTSTKAKLKGGKSNPMQDRVTKKTVGAKMMLFSNVGNDAYEKMVKSRMETEGKDPESFELKPRAWGTRIENTPFVEHKGNYYIELYHIESGKTIYFLDDEEINKDEIEGLEDKKVNEDSQGGIANKVIVRTYSMDSIENLTITSKIN